jgi:fatty-acyl-CoA synthase
MRLIGDVLKRNAKLFPNKPGLIFGNKVVEFKELNKMTNRISNGLVELGVNKSDCVIFLDRNCYEWVAVYFGLAKSGAVYLPLNYMSGEKDLLHWAAYSEATAIIFGSSYSKTIESLRPQLDGVKRFICINHDRIELPEGIIDFDTFFSSKPSIEPDRELDENDPYMIVQTT